MGVREDAAHWSEFPVLKEMDFEALATRYRELKEGIDQMEAERKDISADMEAALIVADQKRVKFGDKYVIERAGGRSASTISANKLVEKGVTPDVIAYATVPGRTYTYCQMVDTTKASQGRGKKGEGTATDGDA